MFSIIYNENIISAKPFLKWAGGKKQLLPEIINRLPESILTSKTIEYYFEPFVGAGAVFFYLMSNFHIKNAYISDINKELILVYNVIKNDPNDLINFLKELETKFLKLNTTDRKEFYLDIRQKFNNQLTITYPNDYTNYNIYRAAYIIFMNKTGFNGLFRLNKKGEFNVPFGKYKNPKICDENNILNVHKLLKDVTIKNTSYLDSEKFINENSFVYLDPPYRPLTKSANFTSYTSNDFNDKQQIELGEYYKRINDKHAKVMLSNSDPKNVDLNDNFFDSLYSDFNIDRVQARRNINSNAKKRGQINELIIRNY